jgi:hypothetical protein
MANNPGDYQNYAVMQQQKCRTSALEEIELISQN